MIDDDPVRRTLVIASLLLLGACTNARVVDCEPGRFVRASGEAWCIFARGVAVGCPPALPAEHALPWGGRGCAAVEHDPLPEDLCAAAGACDGDAG